MAGESEFAFECGTEYEKSFSLLGSAALLCELSKRHKRENERRRYVRVNGMGWD